MIRSKKGTGRDEEEMPRLRVRIWGRGSKDARWVAVGSFSWWVWRVLPQGRQGTNGNCMPVIIG